MEDSKKNIQPNVLSDVLLAEYVLKKEGNQQFKIDPSWNASESFDDFIVLYKIALVLIALLNMESKDQKFFQVRLIFEKAVFIDGNIQKLYFYHHVKSAMDKLGELLDTGNHKLDNLKDQNEKMGWAMAWLKDAGILETNPAILTQFALMWMDNYFAIVDYLKEYKAR